MLPKHSILLRNREAIFLNYDNGQIDHYHNISLPGYKTDWRLVASYYNECSFEKAFPNWVNDLRQDDDWANIAWFWTDIRDKVFA